MKPIPNSQARLITGHNNNASMIRWINRRNERGEGTVILRTKRAVDLDTLQKAIDEEVESATPALAVRRSRSKRRISEAMKNKEINQGAFPD